jgi:nicotinamide phosphoribosyltransferase
MEAIKHYGDYTEAELMAMTPRQLIDIIQSIQMEDNFIIMTDSYKMTHHLLYPELLQEVYSYMESRGGEMPYTVFTLLQYMLKKYFAGVRITQEKIDEAREKNIKHFGFDCFDSTMWDHILKHHGGKLPLEIKAVPEGTPVAVKNVIMTIRNTDRKCAPLTNVSETLLMKLWAPNTVAAYARLVRTLIHKYHELSSDAPKFLIDFMHHDFGYRGVSSEESARILGAAALSTGFVGTDTMGALVLAEKYYNEPMAGFSVIASEHSVMQTYCGNITEEYYVEVEYDDSMRIISEVEIPNPNL